MKWGGGRSAGKKGVATSGKKSYPHLLWGVCVINVISVWCASCLGQLSAGMGVSIGCCYGTGQARTARRVVWLQLSLDNWQSLSLSALENLLFGMWPSGGRALSWRAKSVFNKSHGRSGGIYLSYRVAIPVAT